jgi:hypothetical protein
MRHTSCFMRNVALYPRADYASTMLALVVGSSFVMSGDNNAQRRSHRVMLNASILVEARGPDNKLVSEQTRTVVVNAHGGVILLSVTVSMGQLLTLRNSQTEEEAPCRVAYVSPHLLEKKKVGVEFTKPCPRFWGIAFPPSDWTTRSPEAKQK